MSSNRPHEGDPLAPHRGRLLGLAYRMLGSRSDAEDVAQDAHLRFAGAQNVHNPEAFLVTIVTRLCLDRLKSAKATSELRLPLARQVPSASVKSAPATESPAPKMPPPICSSIPKK